MNKLYYRINIFTNIRNNKYIKKINQSKITIALIINFIFLALILLFCDMKYEVSDDFVMASILSGGYGNNVNPQMIFVNVIIGYLLIPFYKIFPQISWYFVFQVSIIFISSIVISMLLLEIMNQKKAVMLSIIINIFFANDAYILLQFTKTAMFAVMSGGLLFIWAVFSKRKVKVIIGAILCLIGSMIRFSVIYIAGPFFLLVLIYKFYILWKERKKDGGNQVRKIFISGLALILIVFGFKAIDRYTYSNDEAHRYFYSYGEARSQIVDYADYGYQAYAEELEKIGVSENDYYMMRTWSFADNQVFSLEIMQQTAKIIKDYNEQVTITAEEIVEKMQDRVITGYPIFGACALLLVLGAYLNKEKWWTMIVCFLIGGGILVYFFYIGRVLYRVEFCVFLGMFLTGCCFWDSHLEYADINLMVEKGKSQCCSIIMYICVFINLAIYIPDYTYINVDSATRMSYINNTFNNSWSYDAKKYRKVVNKDVPSNALIEMFNKRKDNLYFLDFSTTIQTLYFEWRPWRAISVGYFNNAVYLGGIISNFPDIINLLDKRGISNPLSSLVEENVYLVDNYGVEIKLNYLKEHYYPEARVEFVEEADGYQIWKFYSE